MRIIELKTRNNIDELFTVYNVNDFPYRVISFTSSIFKQATGTRYNNMIGAFDIETTKYFNSKKEVKQAMFHWQFALEHKVCVGRTFEELIFFLKNLEHYTRYKQKILVHNLSYEFMFICQHLLKNWDDVKIRFHESRKVQSINFGAFEFVDSYMMTLCSLNKLCEDYKVDHSKTKGDLDFEKLYNINTVLTDKELGYCVNDVLSLVEWWHLLEKTTGYNITSMPITKTGFVRTDCRQASYKDLSHRQFFINMSLTYEQYKRVEKSFQGGYAAISERFRNQTVVGDIRCRDITSSYPYQMLNRYFPSSPFIDLGYIPELEDFLNLLRNNCVIFKAQFKNIKMKDDAITPIINFIPIKMKIVKPLKWNGKIYSAEYLEKYMTEIEFFDILETYNFEDFYFDDIMFCKRGRIPEWLKGKVIEYFDKKSKLKGIESEELNYMLAKANLNSLYGMCATSLCKHELYLDIEEMRGVESYDMSNEELLIKYYHSRSSFMIYQYCTYVTSWARHQLFHMQKICGIDNFIYSDTDSVYYISTPEIEQKFEDWNKEIRKNTYRSMKSDGTYTHMGEVTPDGEYVEFRGLGAKKYAKRDKKGKLSITVAGVPKSGVLELNDDINNLREGLVFHGSVTGKLISEYNIEDIHTENVNGVMTETASYIRLYPCDYTLENSLFEYL